jgi:hypothetical protein
MNHLPNSLLILRPIDRLHSVPEFADREENRACVSSLNVNSKDVEGIAVSFRLLLSLNFNWAALRPIQRQTNLKLLVLACDKVWKTEFEQAERFCTLDNLAFDQVIVLDLKL